MQMDVQEKKLSRYAQAVSCLPPALMGAALSRTDAQKENTNELRLRAGCPMTAVCGGREEPVGVAPVTAEDLRDTLARAARWSVHSYADCLKSGYLPLAGGHRLGICGTAGVQNGQVVGIRVLSSLNLRIAQEHPGMADGLLDGVSEPDDVENTLILSPPGFGKTSLLRDMIRTLSSRGIRVGVADERGELAALHEGVPGFSLGTCCDVLEGCPKAAAAIQLIRTMSPDVVALDELTDPTDLEAVQWAANCGVAVLATIHARDAAELARKPFYRQLLDARIFTRAVVIARDGQNRICRSERLGGGAGDA